jgi:hypothetical protein
MTQPENSQPCHCSSDGFFITNRQTSMICSLLILLFLMSFVSGYFWGHGKATQEFTEKLVDDSFTDKINYSFYSNFEKTPPEPELDADSAEEDFEEVESTPFALSNVEGPNVVVKEDEKEVKVNQGNALTIKNELPQSDTNYYAELVGFGTLQAAQNFVQKARQHGFNIDIKQRVSKTAKGRTIYWFQAITEKLGNKDQLMDLVAKIQKTEKIKDVKIIEEKKQQHKG